MEQDVQQMILATYRPYVPQKKLKLPLPCLYLYFLVSYQIRLCFLIGRNCSQRMLFIRQIIDSPFLVSVLVTKVVLSTFLIIYLCNGLIINPKTGNTTNGIVRHAHRRTTHETFRYCAQTPRELTIRLSQSVGNTILNSLT